MNPESRLWFIPLIILLLSLLIIGIFVIPRYLAATDARVGLHSYCLLKGGIDDCKQWSDDKFAGYQADVMECFYAHRYPELEGSYFQCLRERGI